MRAWAIIVVGWAGVVRAEEVDEPVPAPAPSPQTGSATAPGSLEPSVDPAPPPPPRQRTPFDRGRVSLSFGLSTQSGFGERYYVIAGGFGYYVLEGLAPALHVAHWFGSGPSVTQVSPELRYVITAVPGSIKPTLGVFFTRWIVGDGLPDVDTVGGRGGIVSWGQSGWVLGLGVVVEQVVSTCSGDCTDVYPDVTLSFSL